MIDTFVAIDLFTIKFSQPVTMVIRVLLANAPCSPQHLTPYHSKAALFNQDLFVGVWPLAVETV